MKSKKVKNKVNKDSRSSLSSAIETDTENGIWKDARFAHLVSDPRFKSIKKETKKIKIDKRFAGMFNDEKFNVKYSIDKYGRRLGTTSSSNDMKKYYEMSSSDSDDNDEVEQKEEEKRMIDESEKDELVNLGSDDDVIPDNLMAKLKDIDVDYARGEGKLYSDDDSSDDDSLEDGDKSEDELFIEHCWGELDAEAPRTNESTYRLAACNMDWDRIRASDIMVLCSSFLPATGSINSVKACNLICYIIYFFFFQKNFFLQIYPSEYGKERMANEEVKGPQELTNDSKYINYDSDNDNSKVNEEEKENEEGIDFNMEKLRQYQLNRLKYYYAVIECDRVSTADKLYSECDGLEYESTATKLDLRFIPDDMNFNDEPKDECTELPDMSKYMPRLFTTTALQQAKVELTWDENDVDRKELNDKLSSGKFNEVADQELRKYVAYSSSSESENEDNDQQHVETNVDTTKIKDPIKKYKALLQEIQTKEEKVKNQRIEMEYSWHIGDSCTEKLDEKLDPKKDDSKTHFDKILEFKQQKKKQRKDDKKKKMKLLKSGNLDGNDNNKKNESDNDESSDYDLDGIDMNDPYFAEEFADGEFDQLKKKKKKVTKDIGRSNSNDIETKLNEAELQLLMDDDDDNNDLGTKAHFSLKKIQSTENDSKAKKGKNKLKKRTKKQNDAEKILLEDHFNMNVNDSRFASVYSSHLYNIDPTHASYKKTKGMEALIKEKLNRIPDNYNLKSYESNNSKKLANNMLVKSIKRKIHNS